MVVWIVAICLVAGVLNTRTKYRARSRDEEPDAAASQARLDELEERVRVLERIVTDRNAELDREFRRLDEAS